ncbi:unnamed protein product [Meganyctiphanes norvegica]|uniref:Uncharacterized protein n=1 Tax=Meganyctiphanes norvegica TaxID=48144 RepID=A0AAV2RQS4_MEGNR
MMSVVTGKLVVILLQVLLQQSLAGGTTLLKGAEPVLEDEELAHNPYIRMPIGPMESENCNSNQDCVDIFDNFNLAMLMDTEGNIVHKPYCEITGNTTTPLWGESYNTSDTTDASSTLAPLGVCTCGRAPDGQELCPSWTLTWGDTSVWYCGPCGRIGSQCDVNRTTCSYLYSYCDTSDDPSYCKCTDDGKFYELYYCYIPYYGYQVALQSTLIIGIVVVICLFLATAYNALRMRRIRRLQAMGLWNNGRVVSEAPPEDTPPKYDDVVENLPSYQDALQMEENVDGIVNTAFEEDSISLPPSYEEIKPNLNKPNSRNKTNESHIQKENVIVRNDSDTNQEHKNESSNEINHKEESAIHPEKHLNDVSIKEEVVKEDLLQVQSQPIEQPIQSALHNVQI